MPILVEGYTPPDDPRLTVLKVTPDPGVIEINTHPTHNWKQLVELTHALYEEARQVHLGAEKFLKDGRHTGTGGGNHIVVGGPTPKDSPFLRRPHLLRSLINYWHNHPSLSYTFAGLFVGPTSQAPRLDEARNDQVYELELAFRQIPDQGDVPPWLVDRVFRNILIDAAGNTHRAEICIDKLYNPDSPTGRLGLVEFRAFEMPPHPQMALAQQILLRALISRFWQQPYKQPLVRWRTELHDRFMLPHFLQQDLDDVTQDLRDSGYNITTDLFAPQLAFRFPIIGGFNDRGVNIELRQALEPWHVLGEEGAPGGTVRYVDSSVERIEVKVDGMVDARHVVTCNGQAVPLTPTGTNGQFVAGVRYRAWKPYNGLHPHIPVDSPLIFDLVDTWAGRSVAGCKYYVVHPGGRVYEHSPINSYEAESRRVARFFTFGHTPGQMDVAPPVIRREFPLTLDMRYGH
jgi:uncharacterized protein (DUF2126 family)